MQTASSLIVTGFGAFWRGALVAFLCFVTFGALYPLAFFYFNGGFPKNVARVLGTFGVVLGVGFVWVGWWATLLGGLSGWLLLMWRRTR